MQRLTTCLPPAILFEKSESKKDKSEEDKDKFKTFDMSESESDHSEQGHNIKKLSKFDSDDLTTTSEQSEEYFVTNIFNTRPKKQTRLGQVTTEVVGEIQLLNNEVALIRCLLDTGTTSTMIQKPFVHNTIKVKSEKTRWRTMGGTFETNRKAKISFKLPEFSHNRIINWVAHVDESNDRHINKYDMIIGTDLLTELKVTINYDSKHVIWDDISVPMKEKGAINDPEMTQTLYELTKESSILKMSEDRHNEIITAMYGNIDIKQHVRTLKHLNDKQQEQLIKVLNAYPS